MFLQKDRKYTVTQQLLNEYKAAAIENAKLLLSEAEILLTNIMLVPTFYPVRRWKKREKPTKLSLH